MKRRKEIMWIILILCCVTLVACAHPRAKIVDASPAPDEHDEAEHVEYIKKKMLFPMYFIDEERSEAFAIASNLDFLLSASCLEKFGMIVSEDDVGKAETYLWEIGVEVDPATPWTPLKEEFEGLEKPHEKFFRLPSIFREVCKE